MDYIVEVHERKTKKVIHDIPVQGSRDRAERIERGLNINLNHEDYYTGIREVKK